MPPVIPKVTVINTTQKFGVEVQTDKGMEYHPMNSRGYEFPVFWKFKGNRWMVITEYYLDEIIDQVDCMVPIQLTFHVQNPKKDQAQGR